MTTRLSDPASHRLLAWLPLVGVGIALFGLGVTGFIWMTSPGLAVVGLTSAASLFIAGKEGGIPLGLAAGAAAGLPYSESAWVVGGMIWVADTASMCVLYPLVDRSLDVVERRHGFLGKTLATLRKRGERRKGWVTKYGQLGLYSFMLIPFAFNGPLQAAVVGRLAGMRPVRVLPVLVAGITTTTVAWTLLYVKLLGQALHVSPLLPVIVSLGVSGGVILMAALATRSETRRERAEQAEQAHPAAQADQQPAQDP